MATTSTDPLCKLGLRDLEASVVMVLHPQRYHLATMIAVDGDDGFELAVDYPVPKLSEVTEVICDGQKFLVPETLLERFSRVKARGKIFYKSFNSGLPEQHYRLVITDPRFRNDYVRAVEALRHQTPLSIGSSKSLQLAEN